jgi:hypothetical protein
MVYQGHVKDGVVVFDTAAPPEGAAVQVNVVESVPEPGNIWTKLRKYSGAVRGLPSDMARNHDHYIHGAPKK